MRLVGVHRLHYRMGGAEAVHLDHLALFRERGWDCAEFAMAHPKNEPSAFAHYFPSYFDAGEAQGLARVGATGRFLHSAEAGQKFAQLLDDFRPDIVHVHGIYHQLTPAIIPPAMERNIPIVFTLHDYKIICPAYHFFRPGVGVCEDCRGGRQYMCAVHKCAHGSLPADSIYALDGWLQWHRGTVRDTVSAFIGPCEFIVDKFAEHGIAREKLHYVPNFFQTTDDRPVEPQAVAALRARYGRYVLFFGRLSVEKGLTDLVAAAAIADVPVVFVGEGKEEQALRKQAAALGVTAHFTGHLTGADLWAHVEAAHAVALPSIWYEIAPKSILEAQARGKAVITTAIGGLPEMVEDGVTGFVAPPNDVPALARAIGRAFTSDDAALAAIGEAARQRALTNFTTDRYYREMTAIYDALLAQRRSSESRQRGVA
jgi:glycosyltransferase involved in cell wall biosynthesis